jgi:toxin secretion/phage lysis holin
MEYFSIRSKNMTPIFLLKQNGPAYLLSGIFSAFLSLMGGPHILLWALCWLIVIDYFSGVIAAQYKGIPFDWDIAMKGVYRKLMYFLVVLFGAVMDRLSAECHEIGMNTNGHIRLAFLIVLVGIEATSILRHFGMCDITTPEWIRQTIKSMKNGKGGNDEN